MARGMDPESRPISVAELLARAKEQGADDVVAAVGNSPAATGRRRRGGKDSVSVAELTGEIPRVKAADVAQPKAADTSRPEAAQVSRPEAAQVSRSEAAQVSRSKADSPSTAAQARQPETGTAPVTLPPTRDFSTSEVSKRAAATAESGIKPTPGAPDRPAPLRARPGTAESGTGRAPQSRSAATSGVMSAQGTAEQDSATRSTADDADEETTGVIPSMQAYSQVDDSDDDHRVLSAAEREREFERYRNFEDVETGDGPGAATAGGKKKKKRGVFGFGRKPESATTPVTGDDSDDHSDRTVTQFIPKVGGQPGESGTAGPVSEAATPATDREPAPAPEDVPTQREPMVQAADDRYLRFDADADTADADEDINTAKSPEVLDESPTSEIGRFRGTGAAGAESERDDAEVKPGKTSLIKRGAETLDSKRESATGTSGAAEEQSPTVQWLVLIGQVLAGLVVGVALFWGFTELWRWNVLFALILSVAVIFGLVTLVHVVRRSNDLISTLLALGVGLLVTIGPLVLLLIAGD